MKVNLLRVWISDHQMNESFNPSHPIKFVIIFPDSSATLLTWHVIFWSRLLILLDFNMSTDRSNWMKMMPSCPEVASDTPSTSIQLLHCGPNETNRHIVAHDSFSAPVSRNMSRSFHMRLDQAEDQHSSISADIDTFIDSTICAHQSSAHLAPTSNQELTRTHDKLKLKDKTKSKSKAKSKKKMTRIVLLHCDIIQDEFWSSRPELLSEWRSSLGHRIFITFLAQNWLWSGCLSICAFFRGSHMCRMAISGNWQLPFGIFLWVIIRDSNKELQGFAGQRHQSKDTILGWDKYSINRAWIQTSGTRVIESHGDCSLDDIRSDPTGSGISTIAMTKCIVMSIYSDARYSQARPLTKCTNSHAFPVEAVRLACLPECSIMVLFLLFNEPYRHIEKIYQDHGVLW